MADPLGFLSGAVRGLMPQAPADPAIAEANTRAILEAVAPKSMPLAGPPPGLEALRARGVQSVTPDLSGLVAGIPEPSRQAMFDAALDPELAARLAAGPETQPSIPGQLSDEEMQALISGGQGAPSRGGGVPLIDTSGLEGTLAGVRGLRKRTSAADRATEKRMRLEAEKARIAEIKRSSLEADAARESAAVMEGAERGMAQAKTDYEARQRQAQAQVDQRMAAWDTAVKERQAAKLDPDGWYKTAAGTPDFSRRIGSAIAIALGTLGSKLGGGENEALRIIQASIARDLEAQRAKLAAKQQDSQDALTALGLARQHYSDGRDQYVAARADMMQDTAFRLKRMAESSKAPQLKAAAEGLSAKLQLQAEKELAAMRAGAAQREFQGLQAEGVLQNQLAAARAKNAAMLAGPSAEDPEFFGVAPIGSRIPKLDSAAKEKVRGVIGNHTAAAASLDRLLEVREKMGATWIPFLRTMDGQAMVAEAVSSIVPLYGMSSESVARVLKDPSLIGLPADPEAIGYNLTAGAKELRQGITRRANAVLKGYGLRLDIGTQRRQRMPGAGESPER